MKSSFLLKAAPVARSMNPLVRRAGLLPAGLGCGLLCLALTQNAWAQYRGPISETAPLFALDTPTSYANTAFTPPVESMVLPWERLIKRLNRKGIGIVADYTS